MNQLLSLEAQVLAEGREWTRGPKPTQSAAVCPHSGLVLRDVRRRAITLRTCAGEVSVQAAYGFFTKTRRWLCPAREHWQLDPCQCVSPELQQRVAYSATQTGSYEKAAAMAARWGSPVPCQGKRGNGSHNKRGGGDKGSVRSVKEGIGE